MNNVVLSIYTRPGCHLCDDMLTGLKVWQEKFSFEIQLINIDLEKELTDRFAARIPVLAAGEKEICEYVLNNNALKDFFEDLEN